MRERTSFWSSRRRGGLPVWIGAAILAVILAGGWIGLGSSEKHDAVEEPFWRAGVAVPIAVRDGRATFRVATPKPASEVLVVVSALARSSDRFSLELLARTASRATVPALANDGRAAIPKRKQEPPPIHPDSEPSPDPPPHERIFHMMVRDGDVLAASNYTSVRGVLAGVGRRIQVYAASEDIDQVSPDLVKDIIVTFDERIHPVSASRFGAAGDVDGDGRFTILLSSWLNYLGGGRYAVDGFVRVADLDATFRSPFGNRCDMMYLSTALKRGPYLRTVLAHEYMHAVIFSQKSLRGRHDARPGMEEEGWLDEAMAHLAEDLHGFSTSNIDYRVSAFLTCPERYRLLVDDYYAADLFRSHGNRGSTYLFLRWCADQYGPELLGELVRSELRGTANLEAATGSTFAGLYRRWSLALFQRDLEPAAEQPNAAEDSSVSVKMRSAHEESELAGPRTTRIVPGGPADRWTAVGTSSHFVIVDGSASGAVEIEVAGPPAADLQVTALPIGADLARLDLSVTKTRGPSGELSLRAHVKERHGIPVRLSALSWEPLTPGPNPHSSGFRRGRLDTLAVANAFGTSALPASGELRSRPIRLSGISSTAGPIVVKLVGTDVKGRRVAAWAALDAEP